MKKHYKTLVKTLKECPDVAMKLLIECWNEETPHFGGSGPHRYDDADKECCYCNRPKDWKNSGNPYAWMEKNK